MKKTFAIILASIILMSLFGCGNDNSDNSAENTENSASSASKIESKVESNKAESKVQNNTESNKAESKAESKVESSNVESKVESKVESSKVESKAESNEISNKTKIPKTDIIFDGSYAFLGNSIIGDLEAYEVADDADIYSYVGMNVASVFDQKMDNHKKTILEEMLSNNYKTIFIMFGMNEVGWSYSDIFVDDYKELIDEIKAKMPNVKIYLLSITPITKAQEAENESELNTQGINKYNELIKQIAKDKKSTYLDVNSYLRDENGFLSDDDSPDGYHLQPNGSLRMVNAIKYLISK